MLTLSRASRRRHGRADPRPEQPWLAPPPLRRIPHAASHLVAATDANEATCGGWCTGCRHCVKLCDAELDEDGLAPLLPLALPRAPPAYDNATASATHCRSRSGLHRRRDVDASSQGVANPPPPPFTPPIPAAPLSPTAAAPPCSAMNNRTTGGAGATTCSNRSSGSTVCNSRNALELRLQSNDGRRAQGPFVGSSDELAGGDPIAFYTFPQGPDCFFNKITGTRLLLFFL